MNGGQPLKAAEALAATEAEVRSSAPDTELPFYLGASRRLAESAAGAEPAADQGLMEDATTAEEQGVLYLAPLYRLGAITAALARADLAAAEAYWPTVSALETRLADAGGRRMAAKVLISHAALDLARKDATAATQHLEQATALIPEARRAADPDWRWLLLLRAQAEYALGQYPAAARDAQATVARARRDAIDPESSAWMGEALVWQARVELAQGERAAARASAQQAIRHLEQNLAPSHPLIATARTMAAGST
jgi:hypothetical protein